MADLVIFLNCVYFFKLVKLAALQTHVTTARLSLCCVEVMLAGIWNQLRGCVEETWNDCDPITFVTH